MESKRTHKKKKMSLAERYRKAEEIRSVGGVMMAVIYGAMLIGIFLLMLRCA